jgi:hypothetical protein
MAVKERCGRHKLVRQRILIATCASSKGSFVQNSVPPVARNAGKYFGGNGSDGNGPASSKESLFQRNRWMLPRKTMN